MKVLWKGSKMLAVAGNLFFTLVKKEFLASLQQFKKYKNSLKMLDHKIEHSESVCQATHSKVHLL